MLPKVMIVEDELDIRQNYVNTLTKNSEDKYEVLQATLGNEALKILEENENVYFLLTDYDLGKLWPSGLELIKMCRNQEGTLVEKGCSYLLFTAYDNIAQIQADAESEVPGIHVWQKGMFEDFDKALVGHIVTELNRIFPNKQLEEQILGAVKDRLDFNAPIMDIYNYLKAKAKRFQLNEQGMVRVMFEVLLLIAEREGNSEYNPEIEFMCFGDKIYQEIKEAYKGYDKSDPGGEHQENRVSKLYNAIEAIFIENLKENMDHFLDKVYIKDSDWMIKRSKDFGSLIKLGNKAINKNLKKYHNQNNQKSSMKLTYMDFEILIGLGGWEGEGKRSNQNYSDIFNTGIKGWDSVKNGLLVKLDEVRNHRNALPHYSPHEKKKNFQEKEDNILEFLRFLKKENIFCRNI